MFDSEVSFQGQYHKILSHSCLWHLLDLGFVRTLIPPNGLWSGEITQQDEISTTSQNIKGAY